MRRSQWQLTLGLILTTLANAAAHPNKTATSLTVTVKDYANVDVRTLVEAERIATKVYEKAGVKIDWSNLDRVSNDGPADLRCEDLTALSVLKVHILSEKMANRLGMPNEVMGLAPGKGPDRRLVYVFYPFVKKLAQRQVQEESRANPLKYAAVAQILGEMMAHELGHVLNLPSHSQTGIMKGNWDLVDLWNVSYGSLLFTKQQAEVIRTEAARRNRTQAPGVGIASSEHAIALK
jgi:hypothetical protein